MKDSQDENPSYTDMRHLDDAEGKVLFKILLRVEIVIMFQQREHDFKIQSRRRIMESWEGKRR